MDSWARFTIEHARFSGLLLSAVLLAGLAVYATQPRQEDPEVTVRNAQVVTQFPGMAPERVEQLITRPIENAIKEIEAVEDIESISMTGISLVTLKVHDRYFELDPIWTDLRNKMDDLQPALPSGTEGPLVSDDYGRVAVVTLALTGTEYTMVELNEVTKDLKDSLGALPLVARVDLHGVQDERIWLEFDPSFMAQFELTPEAIVSAMRGQNVILPGGAVNAAGQNVVIEPSGDFRSVDDIRNLAIETGDGYLVYLQDLASIRRAYVDPPKSPAYYNDQPAIVLGISMIPASNVVDNGVVIAEDISQRLNAGVSRLEAVLATPKILASPLLTSSLTTVVAFLPLVLIDDQTGEFLRSLGQVLALALLSSWVLAVAVTPAFCHWFLPVRVDGGQDVKSGYETGAYTFY